MKRCLPVFFSILLMSGLIGCTTDYCITVAVESDASSVIINNGPAITELPWWEEYHDIIYYDDDDSVNTIILNAENNTAENASITAYIYVNGDLKAKDSCTGPHCSVSLEYDPEQNNN